MKEPPDNLTVLSEGIKLPKHWYKKRQYYKKLRQTMDKAIGDTHVIMVSTPSGTNPYYQAFIRMQHPLEYAEMEVSTCGN